MGWTPPHSHRGVDGPCSGQVVADTFLSSNRHLLFPRGETPPKGVFVQAP